MQMIIFSGNCRVFTEYLEYPDATPLSTRKPATREGAFIWSDDEAELLLDVTLEYCVRQTAKGVDWESVQTKYGDIAHKLRLMIHKSRETGELEIDYPHAPAEIT